jgi:hypothetical protein
MHSICLINQAHDVFSKTCMNIWHRSACQEFNWQHLPYERSQNMHTCLCGELRGLNDEHVGCTNKRMKGTYPLRRKRKPKHRNVERNTFMSRQRHRQGKEKATMASQRAVSRSSGTTTKKSTPISERV